MKRLLVAAIITSLLLCSCEDDDTDYAALLTGTWVNTHVDNVPVLTDDSYVCQYRPDMVQFYAQGVRLDENNKTWRESDTYTYQVEGRMIIIDGTDVNNKTYHLELEIVAMTRNSFTEVVKEYKVDNVNYPDPKSYTYHRVTEDYSDQFVGVWYGHCTTPGTSDTGYHYWEYFADGSFNYYYQDENDDWVRKSDNDGGYFLYGNLMASNYTNDLISGGTGKAYECWNFQITGNNMIWTGLRENGQTITYEMSKVAQAPL